VLPSFVSYRCGLGVYDTFVGLVSFLFSIFSSAFAFGWETVDNVVFFSMLCCAFLATPIACSACESDELVLVFLLDDHSITLISRFRLRIEESVHRIIMSVETQHLGVIRIRQDFMIEYKVYLLSGK